MACVDNIKKEVVVWGDDEKCVSGELVGAKVSFLGEEFSPGGDTDDATMSKNGSVEKMQRTKADSAMKPTKRKGLVGDARGFRGNNGRRDGEPSYWVFPGGF